MSREDWTYAQLCQAVLQASPKADPAGRPVRAVALEVGSLPPWKAGRSNRAIMGASAEEMDGGTWRFHCEIEIE